jgi:RNA polymerase sigma-70 factor (ECF subfamily)
MPPETLERLYDEHAPSMFRYLHGMLSNEHDVKDVLQEIFIHLAKNDCPDSPESERAWLFRIAHNAAIDHIRRNRTREKYTESFSQQPRTESELPPRPDTSSVPSVLDAALLQLPEEQASITRLHLLEGLTFDAIAKIQSVPLNTVTSRFRYALAKLRPLLEPLYEALK